MVRQVKPASPKLGRWQSSEEGNLETPQVRQGIADDVSSSAICPDSPRLSCIAIWLRQFGLDACCTRVVQYTGIPVNRREFVAAEVIALRLS